MASQVPGYATSFSELAMALLAASQVVIGNFLTWQGEKSTDEAASNKKTLLSGGGR